MHPPRSLPSTRNIAKQILNIAQAALSSTNGQLKSTIVNDPGSNDQMSDLAIFALIFESSSLIRFCSKSRFCRFPFLVSGKFGVCCCFVFVPSSPGKCRKLSSSESRVFSIAFWASFSVSRSSLLLKSLKSRPFLVGSFVAIDRRILQTD